MPHLARLRFVRIGHKQARADDLLMDFMVDGKPADSTVWLRNGGGKSSLLSLFFSLLVPQLRQFLGTKTEGSDRQLDEYVRPGQLGMIAAEWVLDQSQLQILGADRLVTGTLLERVEGRGDTPADLERAFFTCRSLEHATESRIDGLPVNAPNGRPHTLKGFRMAWQNLRQRYPEANADFIERQSAWVSTLEAVGLDPKLFQAQLTMNQGEGEAERLFSSLRTAEDYVRFFLDLLAPSDMATGLVQTLEQHRQTLRTRTTQLLPEQDLVRGALEHLDRMLPVHQQRVACADRLVAALSRARGLEAVLAQELIAARHAETDASLTVEQSNAQILTRRADAEASVRERTWCLRWVKEQEWASARRDEETAKEEHSFAVRQQATWTAAATLRTIRRREQDLLGLDEQMRAQLAEYRPLLMEVEAAGTRLAEALMARVTQADHDLATAAARVVVAEESQRISQRDEVDCAARAARHDAAAKDARERARQANRELERHLSSGALATDEAVPDAISRRQRELSAAEDDLRQSTEAREVARKARDEATAELRRAQVARAEAGVARDAARHQLTEAETESQELVKDVELSRLLDIDHGALSPRTLTGSAVSRLRQIAGEARERVLTAHVELSGEARALAHLRTHGVLPPSPVVERLLGLLAARVPRAWDGWQYLASVFALEEARRIVELAPAVATGIVVPDEHFEVAVAALRAVAPDLDDPVLVARQSSVGGEGGLIQGAVIGPSDDAHLSQQAGAAARERRAVHHDSGLRLKAEAERLADGAERQATRLEGWLARRSVAWWQATEAEASRLSALVEQAEGEVFAATQRLAETTKSSDDAESRVERARAAIIGTQRIIDALKLWQRQFPGGLEALGTREREEEQARAVAHAGVLAAKERQTEARAELARARDLEGPARERRVRAEEALKAIVHLPTGATIGSVPGDVEVLESAYRAKAQQYERTVGVSELQERRVGIQRELENDRASFTKRCATITQAEVIRAYEGLPDPGVIEDLEREAAEHVGRAFNRYGNAASLRSRADTALESAEREWQAARGTSVVSPESPATPSEAEARIERARWDEEAARRDVVTAEEYLALAQEELRKAQGRIQQTELDQERLASPTKGIEGMVGALRRPIPRAASDSPVGAERRAFLDALQRQRDGDADVLRSLDKDRDAIVQGLAAWCDDERFTGLKHSVGPKLRRFPAEEVEANAEMLQGELRLRADTIAADLAASDRDRDLLIQGILGAAQDGLSLLEWLAKRSRIPERVAVLGGKHLLQFKGDAPTLEVERRARIGTLLDAYVTADQLPGATRLLQEAVLRLAGSIQLRVLRPSMETMPVYEPITTLAKFSGGEKLTVATLLYCAIATTRAHTVGRREGGTSVLLMDNPFGKASRASFIELQRAVAAQLGVQLIYLTGIIDYEALVCFPNVIRLKNSRFDRMTGEMIIEGGDRTETESELSAYRIARRESVIR